MLSYQRLVNIRGALTARDEQLILPTQEYIICILLTDPQKESEKGGYVAGEDPKLSNKPLSNDLRPGEILTLNFVPAKMSFTLIPVLPVRALHTAHFIQQSHDALILGTHTEHAHVSETVTSFQY